MLTRPGRGFTLIEFMVTLGIVAVLVSMLAYPMVTLINNARLRSMADSLQNGLRLAQGESIRRARQSVFALTNTSISTLTASANNTTTYLSGIAAANGVNWFVQLLPVSAYENNSTVAATCTADTALQTGCFSPLVQTGVSVTNGNVTITGPAQVCFNALGRPIALTAVPTVTPTVALTCSVATNPVVYQLTAGSTNRQLNVQLFIGGKVRLCDPSRTLSATSPDAC